MLFLFRFLIRPLFLRDMGFAGKSAFRLAQDICGRFAQAQAQL
jgi:hypothetical protein